MRRLHAAGLAMLALTSGCYHITIRSGHSPTSDPVESYDGKWRSTTVLDVAPGASLTPCGRGHG